MQSQNLLLTPKWKQRTYDTHTKHLKLYANNEFKLVFLGDSMMERWLSTGKQYWKNSFVDCANLGVGGDGIEHLLYRLTENKEFKGILDVINVDKIIFMIGSNNLSKCSVDDILRGTINIIELIFKKQPKCELIVYGLLDVVGIDKNKIVELNTKLSEYIKQQHNHNLTYRFFGHKVNHDDKFFDDNIHLSTLGYQVWHDDILID